VAAFYELLVHTLIRFREKRRERLSEVISRYGLIRLLEFKYSD